MKLQKINRFVVKMVVMVVTVMLVCGQSVFASGRYKEVTQDYTTQSQYYLNYTETSGNGGVFLVQQPVTLTVLDKVMFYGNSASGYGGSIEVNKTGAVVNIDSDVSFNYNHANLGGAVYNYPGTMTIKDNVSFYHNYTTVQSGGAIYNGDGGSITIGNGATFEENNVDAQDCVGGAIFNEGNLIIGNVAKFEGNYSDKGAGGAIYNGKNKVSIGEYVEFNSNSAKTFGGAISNVADFTIGNASFKDNSAKNGGAIYNNDDFTIENKNERKEALTLNSIFNLNTATENGGAIYSETNTANFRIGDYTGFVMNSSQENGGAIYNKNGMFNLGSTLFDGNSAKNGGAIYNYIDTDIQTCFSVGEGSAFFRNHSTNSGGAIYNEGVFTIGDRVTFQDNYVENYSGGAIYNTNNITIGNLVVFNGNYADDDDGGAIFNNSGTITIGANAEFSNNTAGCYGGAIKNNDISGTITFTDGVKFKDNYAKSYRGGAICNYGTLNLIADTKDVEFTGNKIYAGREDEESNAIYNSGKVNLWAGDRAKIIFNDKIEGSGEININKSITNYQENIGTGKIILNEDMSEFTGNVNIYGGIIKLDNKAKWFTGDVNVADSSIEMLNNKIETVTFNNASIQEELSFTVDVDLKNANMDKVLVSSSYGEGKVNIKEINVIEDSNETKKVSFANLDSIDAERITTISKVRSVLYSYDAKLDHEPDSYNYYYTFKKSCVNPVTAAGAISASVGGYATQSMVMGQAFASMDRQIELKSSARKFNLSNNQIFKSSKLYASAGYKIFDDTGKIERGVWLRPFILNETVKLGEMDVDNNLSGTLAGIDLPVNGDIFASFYLGYAGSKQKMEEIKYNQTGYVLGATGMLIKEKWYAGLTANIIFNKTAVDTDDETNDIDMNMYSIGAKAGYNYDIGKNWILEPNITLMYGMVDCLSYETDKTKVDSQSINNILLEPQVKAKWQLENGWQPYGLLGYAANLSSKPTVKTEAGYLDLDSIDGYLEFGAGVNKDFINTAWSCYLQLTGRAAGRSGFAGNLGIKYKF